MMALTSVHGAGLSYNIATDFGEDRRNAKNIAAIFVYAAILNVIATSIPITETCSTLRY